MRRARAAGPALAACLALAACAPAGPPAAGPGDGRTPAAARALTLVPSAAGIDVQPLGQEIGFGRHRDGAVAAAGRVLGRAPDGLTVPPGCNLAAATWERDGLTMYFLGLDARFVGWRAGGGRTFPGEPRSAGRTC